MKKILVCCLILVLLVSAASGSPLIFKTEKTIKNQNEKEFVELAVVDVSKYRQIRVGVVLVTGTPRKVGNTVVGNTIQGGSS